LFCVTHNLTYTLLQANINLNELTLKPLYQIVFKALRMELSEQYRG